MMRKNQGGDVKKRVEGKRKRSAGWKDEKEEGGQVYGCCYAEM